MISGGGQGWDGGDGMAGEGGEGWWGWDGGGRDGGGGGVDGENQQISFMPAPPQKKFSRLFRSFFSPKFSNLKKFKK